MTINTGMMGITGGVSHADFVRNAQHVGMQKTNGIKSENEETQQASSDSVSISFNQQAEEPKGTKETKENKQTSSTSQTTNTEQAKSSSESKESKEAKQSSSGTVTVDLSSSSAPTAGEIDFNEGAIGSNLLSGETSSETTTGTDLVPVDGNGGNGGSGSTALVPVTDGSTAIVPVNSETDVIPVVDAEIVDDEETVETGNANASTETGSAEQTQQQQQVGFDPTEYMNQLKEMESKWEEINNAWMEIMAAREKHMAEMWKLMMDTQTAIMEIVQQTIQAQAASQERIFMGWDMLINGPR